MRKLDVVLISLLLIFITWNIILQYELVKLKGEKNKENIILQYGINRKVLKNKPVLSEYIPRSDLTLEEGGWFSKEGIPPTEVNYSLINNTYGWKSNGWLELRNNTPNRKGIAVIHPINIKIPRYIETPEFVVPSYGNLVIGLANGNCNLDVSYLNCIDRNLDNIFRIYVVDEEGNVIAKVDELTVKAGDGWLDIMYPIQSLKIKPGTKAKIRVESWAGGNELWNGEFGIVDYIDILL
ncbi:MAG: hypothetical protein ABIM98_07505 [candidate division WOR-3 bacterium]